jgi:hypothetical protein
MRAEVAQVLAEPRLTQAWEMYSAAFADLRATAAQRHVMSEFEFRQVMRDARVGKHFAASDDGDRIAALATFTNDLEAMPLISPEFFARRWPKLYAQRRIWYLGFFAIDPAQRGGGLFEKVIAQMWEPVVREGGIAALDVCAQNVAVGLPAAIERTLRALTPEMVAECVDTQAYWAFGLGDMQ